MEVIGRVESGSAKPALGVRRPRVMPGHSHGCEWYDPMDGGGRIVPGATIESRVRKREACTPQGGIEKNPVAMCHSL